MAGVIVMMGPSLDGRGGMSAVAAAYRDGGLLAQCGVHYIATVADGSRLRKLARALLAWMELVRLVMGRPGVALAHIHVASGASFWRKALYVWTARAARVPVVLHVHGGNFAEWASGRSAAAQRLIRQTCSCAAQVITLSPAWIPRLAGWMPLDRCMAVQNVVAPMAQRPRLLASVRRFLFLGRLEKDKGIDDLLAAFGQVHGRFPDARLVLCGEGNVGHVRALAQQLGIQDALEMPGWVIGQAKLTALHQADAFVLPSYIEGLPVSMLESMQCGLPVVVTAVGSVPEVIRSGVNGLMVQAGDVAGLARSMLALAMDNALAIRLAQAGQATFNERYSVAAVTPLLESVWSAACRD